MNTSKKFLIALLLNLGVYTIAEAQKVAPFHTGDRVVFLGNSITHGGHYHSYIWLYYMTHFPNTRFTCVNAGIGGDVVKQMNDRFEDDVLSKHPTVLTLTWGMNDTGYAEWFKPDADQIGKKHIAESINNYSVLEAKLKKLTNVRKILILGSPYDETTKSNKNRYYPKKSDALGKIIDYEKESAQKNGWEYVDFFHPMLEINKREQAKDSLFSLTPNDRIHPDYDGHLVMASLFLKQQGFANQVVADVNINAANKSVSKSVNCKVTNVMGSNVSISFDYLANSLPYPLDTLIRDVWEGNKKKQSDALKLIPFMQEFNREMLTVKGLKTGNYKLFIDEEEIGQWHAQQLADGINLAEQTNTPQYQQAMQIRDLNEERWDIEQRFRKYAFIQFDLLKDKGLLFADNKAAMDTVNKYSKISPFIRGNRDVYTKAQFKSTRNAWQKEIDVLVNEIYSINKPRVHKIKLVSID